MVGSPTWMRWERPTGMPSSALIVAASSAPRSLSFSAIAASSAARSAGGVAAHLGNAARAAATARSTSSAPAAGMRPMTSSVYGLTTSIVSTVSGAIHPPPTYSRSRIWMGRVMDMVWFPQARTAARAPASAEAIASAVRWASAMVEIIGLTPVAVGSALASPT